MALSNQIFFLRVNITINKKLVICHIQVAQMSTFLKILLEKTTDSERFRGMFHEKLDSLFALLKPPIT